MVKVIGLPFAFFCIKTSAGDQGLFEATESKATGKHLSRIKAKAGRPAGRGLKRLLGALNAATVGLLPSPVARTKILAASTA
jgi:hypothetical protein